MGNTNDCNNDACTHCIAFIDCDICFCDYRIMVAFFATSMLTPVDINRCTRVLRPFYLSIPFYVSSSVTNIYCVHNHTTNE